ncbi:MAG: flagellar hook-associated protein 3 FlgL [Eubacteriales bacterium]|nr:flagellar hook-associated protein 3 FlgL [Eubacteriales bacterium]MDN5364592.1 flagellar hook-associated protein 3 FlgL [Eubacteriales bacterium]
MRITNSMLINNFRRNLNVNLAEMERLQDQMSSGKKIKKPSDDPVNLVSALRLRTTITETEKYVANVNAALSWLETTDVALGQAGDLLQRVRELVVQGANDALPQASRQAIAAEVRQIKEQLLQVANTSHDGRYIFGGFKTLTQPFNAAGNYLGDAVADIQYEISPGIKMTVNVTGDDVFKNPVDVFQLIDDIINDLNTGNTANLSGVRLGAVDRVIDNILRVRADVGARVNRLELTRNRLEETRINVSDLLSRTEDVDMAEIITRLQMQENVYRAALAAGARIIQPTLADFLR